MVNYSFNNEQERDEVPNTYGFFVSPTELEYVYQMKMKDSMHFFSLEWKNQ